VDGLLARVWQVLTTRQRARTAAFELMHPTSRNLITRKYRARFFREDNEGFRSLKNSNILVYFPHGFGDWVFLSYILPFFEPTNRYWITRFGDDSAWLMEGNQWVAPLYVGVPSPHCDDGGAFAIRHFGVSYDEADGGEKEFNFPLPLYEACVKHKIDAVIQTAFGETWGGADFPYHSKARNLLRKMTSPGHLDQKVLGSALKSSISFEVEPALQRWVEAQLKSWIGLGDRKLCIIGRNGYTAVGKNWGHLWRNDLPPGKQREGEECRDFIRLMLKRDPKWMFLIMEDRLFEGDDTVRASDLHTFSYAELFGEVGSGNLPFGLMMKILVKVADLAVGVPAGPYHLCMAYESLPAVGVWIEHLPSWYDEPKAASIHLLSQNINHLKLMERPGSFEENGGLKFRTAWANSRIISGEEVMAAVETLLR